MLEGDRVHFARSAQLCGTVTESVD